VKVKKSTAFAFVVPFLVFFAAFWVIPFVYGLYISLHKYSFAVGRQEFAGLKNYARILVGDSIHKEAFCLGMGNTPMVGATVAVAVAIQQAMTK